MPRPWNIQGRRLSTSESSKCKDQSLGERKWTQAQATLLGFGDKKDKGGKMEETDMIISRNIYWPGMYVGATTWRAPEPFLIVLWCLVFHQTSILLGLFLVWFAWGFFLFLYIYNKSKVSHALKERNPRFWPGPSTLTKKGWTTPKLQQTRQQYAQQRGTNKPQTCHSGFSLSSTTWATVG